MKRDDEGRAAAPTLGDAEAFAGEHLAEPALALLADGAGDLVSTRARAHAESCPACGAAIGEQALASSELHAAFEVMTPAERAELMGASLAGADLAGADDAPRDRSALVLRHVGAAARRGRSAADATKRANAETFELEGGRAKERDDEPSSARRGARGGAMWIAGGLVVAALASAPSLSGVANALSDAQDALLVCIAVGVQLAGSLGAEPGRLDLVQTTATWTSTLAMILAGVWIARRAPQGVALGTERAGAEGTR